LKSSQSYLIIGGGLVGLATAMRIQERFPSASITLLEKEDQVGRHQSTHNSGVLHAGLYYAPGSAKAKLAVSGIKQMTKFCQAENIAHEICGKLVVAVTEDELPRLEELYKRGVQNGLTGLKKFDRKQIKQREPYVNGIAAVYVPEEGIIDYRHVCDRLVEMITDKGGQITTGAKVTKLQFTNGAWLASTKNNEYKGNFLINCAGLYCDHIAEIAGEKSDIKIIPFRGEYFKLKPVAEHLVKHLIYPVPNPSFPFLGVHFTRMIHGGIEAGPNAVLAFAREGYRLSSINPNELIESLMYPGLWRFLQKYPSMAFSELLQSFSKDRFCKSLQRLIPDIRVDHLEQGHAGVRAQAMSSNGDLVSDFALVRGTQSIHVLNAPSPAATASLAIGQYIIAQLCDK
jgi:L-2-hydroxyglutarate oxidase